MIQPSIPIRDLLAAGLSLFPLQKGDKPPRDQGWLSRAYSVEELEAWAAEGGNIGVRLGPEDLVLDYDPRNDLVGDSLARLAVAAGLDLGAMPTVATPTGGLHIYCRVPAGSRLRGKLKSFPGIDLKKRGGYVLAPGCVHPKHPDGPLYALDPSRPELAARQPAPAGLLSFAVRPETVASQVETEAGEGFGEAEVSPAYLAILLATLDPRDFADYEDWIEIGMAAHAATDGDSEAREVFVRWCAQDPAYADAAEHVRSRWDDSFKADTPGGYTARTLFLHVYRATGGKVPTRPAAEVFDQVTLEEQAARVKAEVLAAAAAASPSAAGADAAKGSGVEARASMDINPRDGRARPNLENGMLALRLLGIEAVYDEMADAHFLGGSADEIFAAMFEGDVPRGAVNDEQLVKLRIILERTFRLELTKERMLDVVHGASRRVNPLTEWLDSLTWDGKRRIDTWLQRYFGAEDTPYVQGVSRITLLGAVARAYEPGIKFDTMPVLEGEQGTGKSTGVKILGGEYTAEGLPASDLHEKDNVDSLRGKWIIELDELDSIRRADVSSLKSFLSRTSDRARLAYRRCTEDFPRRCVFIGTTNESHYLHDQTGARRFLPIRTDVIHTGPLKADRDQLWAEAVLAWRENPTEEALVLDRRLWSVAANEQAKRTAQDGWTQMIAHELERKHTDQSELTSSFILEVVLGLGATAINGANGARLAKCMRTLGWKSKHTSKGTVYIRPTNGDPLA